MMRKAIDLNKCPVYNYPARVAEFDFKQRFRVECRACGNFVITTKALAHGEGSKVVEWRSLLSYLVG